MGSKAQPGGRGGEEAGSRIVSFQRSFQKMGFDVRPPARDPQVPGADFWVRLPGGPGPGVPVFVAPPPRTSQDETAQSLLSRWADGVRKARQPPATGSILVVEDDEVASQTAHSLAAFSPVTPLETPTQVRILVMEPGPEGHPAPTHWHRVRLAPRDLLTLATGTLQGLARRAALRASAEGSPGGVPLDIEGMLRELKTRFLVDVEGSLGVQSEEDALFLLYQVAQRHGYAPGDSGGSLHELVQNHTGPAARLPWFAA